jgi:dTDP-4-dehydrorhamnose reductase
VTGEGALTLRTSMIGLGLYRKTSLVDWFPAQKGKVQGYRNAIFSGLTDPRALPRHPHDRREHPQASGLYHLSAGADQQVRLAGETARAAGKERRPRSVDEPRIDRSLDSTRFRRVFSYKPPEWGTMLDELAGETRQAA